MRSSSVLLICLWKKCFLDKICQNVFKTKQSIFDLKFIEPKDANSFFC